MLNIPAFALQLATLYHTRRWLEEDWAVRSYPAVALILGALFCYQGAAVLLLVLGVWVIALGRRRLLLNRRKLAVATGVVLVVTAWFSIWSRWTPDQARWLLAIPHIGRIKKYWIWYAMQMPGAFGPILLASAVLGLAAGLISRRCRREAAISGSWIVVTCLFHSCLLGRDIRYLIPLASPLISLVAVAIRATLAIVGGYLHQRPIRAFSLAATVTLLVTHFELARSVALPRQVDGFEAVVDTIQDTLGPDGGAILDGLGAIDSTLFVCSVMLDDREFRLRVLPFGWLLKYTGFDETAGPLLESEVLEDVLACSGCSLVVVRVDDEAALAPPILLLREVLHGPRYELIRSFAIEGHQPAVIGLYRRLGPVGGLFDVRQGPSGQSKRMEWLLREPITR